MTTHFQTSGKRVQITDYSPYRGLKGTIRHVHCIDDDAEAPVCFYLIALDAPGEPIWFEQTEIAFLDGLPVPVPDMNAGVPV